MVSIPWRTVEHNFNRYFSLNLFKYLPLYVYFCYKLVMKLFGLYNFCIYMLYKLFFCNSLKNSIAQGKLESIRILAPPLVIRFLFWDQIMYRLIDLRVKVDSLVGSNVEVTLHLFIFWFRCEYVIILQVGWSI